MPNKLRLFKSSGVDAVNNPQVAIEERLQVVSGEFFTPEYDKPVKIEKTK